VPRIRAGSSLYSGADKATAERGRIMLEAASVACCLWENGTIVDCNGYAASMFGFDDRGNFLSAFESLFPEYQPDGRLSEEKWRAMFSAAEQSGTIEFEWVFGVANGEISVETTLTAVKEKNGVIAGCMRTIVGRAVGNTEFLITDGMTGAINRRRFMEIVKKRFFENPEISGPVSILIMNVDRMGGINSTYGRALGDAVLKKVAEVTQGVLRPYDLLARYGGDEFIVMIPDSQRSVALRVSERIRSRIENTEMESQAGVTVSLGVAVQSEPTEGFESILERAESMLRYAKNKGRNRAACEK